jgi:integrase
VQNRAATQASIKTFLRGALLYVLFCAYLRRSIIDISNGDFEIFVGALKGERFRDVEGTEVSLGGKRDNRTSDTMLSLIYSIAGDIERLYNVIFDWRRYENMPRNVLNLLRHTSGGQGTFRLVRVHRIKHAIPKAVGIPDEQFVRVICRARELWLDVIPDGDRAYIKDPVELEKQRGALFYRNFAILMVLGGEGARRSEVDPLTMDDIDRRDNLIYLVTKGHGGEKGKRLPVLMMDEVYTAIMQYLMHYRPAVNIPPADRRHVFLSHSPRNYGHRITPETVRKIVDVLRAALEEPWRTRLTPHKFRHWFAYMLQRLGGPLAVVCNMRHACLSSLDAYTADVEQFASELLKPANSRLTDLRNRARLISVSMGGDHE